MSEKDRSKAGLHKKISSIFSGVVIPKSDDEQKSSGSSTSQEINCNESIKHVLETQVSEPSQVSQPSQVLSEDKPIPDSPNELADESEYETTQSSEEVTVEESEIEPAQQPDDEPTSSPDFLTIQDSEEVTVEESEIEPVQQSDDEPTSSPDFLTTQDSEEVTVEESEIEPVQQSDEKLASSPDLSTTRDSEEIAVEESEIEAAQQSDEKPTSPPKFLTAQDSKVIPIEESDIEPAQQSNEKSVESKEFITAKGSKVIPISESDVDPSEQSKDEPVQQSKTESTHKSEIGMTKQDEIQDTKKPKVTPIKQPKADIGSKKTKVKVREQNFWNQITARMFTPKAGVNPTKQKVMVIMIPVLFIFLIIFVVNGGVFGTGGSKAAVDQDNNTTDVASAVSSAQIDWKIPEPYPATLRDPMRLGPMKRKTDQTDSGRSSKIKVKGILYSEDDSSSAIIDNRIVHEGDQVRGVNIKKINKDNVEFEINGETWTQEVQG